MKKLFFIFLLTAAAAEAQTVNIPDPAFKAALLSDTAFIVDENNDTVDLDPNSDGQIELADALRVHTLTVEGFGINDITGITEFTNLAWVNLQNNNIASADFTGLNNLGSIWINNNPLATITIDNMPDLTYFEANNTTLASVVISNCDLLSTIWLTNNPNLQSVNTQGLPQLSALFLNDCGQLENVDASNCPLLEAPDFTNSENLKSLDLSGDVSITDLGLLRNMHLLENLDVSECTLLNVLWVEGPDNALQSVNLTNCAALTNVILSGGKFTSLDLSGAPNINYLVLSDGLLQSLDVTGFNNPVSVICDNNQLQSIVVDDRLADLDVSSNQLVTLDLSQATGLVMLDCTNNPMTHLSIKNGSIEDPIYINNATLQHVCADDGQVAAIENLLPDTIVVNSFCSFVPGGDFNTITGVVKFDPELDGCATDLAAAYTRIVVNDSSTTLTTFTDAQGNYRRHTGTGNYTVTPVPENNALYVSNPVSANANFTTLGNTAQLDFCIQPNGLQPDLEVTVAASNAVRPGFNTTYILVYRNKGNMILSGALQFGFDDAVADFVSSLPAISTQNTGSLTWNYSNLRPLETRTVQLVLHLNGPTDTPPLVEGDQFPYSAAIDLNENELTPADNSVSLVQDLTNSLDPNDKTCLEGTSVSHQKIGEYLHYNINFENIGTADAINVVVRDAINTEQFDLNSLQLLYASHPVYTRINGNFVEFIFENINLPPAISNPIGGHGNVLFKIKTLATLQSGDTVTNAANIYFDYNHPIVTNEARTTFNTLKTNEFPTDDSVNVYPNPVSDKIQISAADPITSVSLYDLQGRILQVSSQNQNVLTLDLSTRTSGVYFAKITTTKGHKVVKLVKK